MAGRLIAAPTAPPTFLQLAGHATRWQLLRVLAHSDQRVTELSSAVGLAQNAASYHLSRLRAGGLVSVRRSSADGRDSYYRIELTHCREQLAAAGIALHPGLVLNQLSGVPARGPMRRRGASVRVLFLCSGNSARSQIAEALLRQVGGAEFTARSAGSHPKPLHPNAVRVMREYGIDLSDHRAKHFDEFSRATLPVRDHPVRQGARGVPGLSWPARQDPLEHPRPRCCRRPRTGELPRVSAHRRGPADAHRVLDPTHRRRGLASRPMSAPESHGQAAHTRPTLATVLREWVRIGCIGFGGPPTHIKLLRELCVERKGWIEPVEFEDAVAACNLLPGPASTQLSILCAWRVRGRLGALVGGAAFILPGLVLILALATVFLAGAPPRWVLAAGAGAGAAIAAVAVHAAAGLVPASWQRAHVSGRTRQLRWIGYLLAGTAAAATLGPWLVLVLLVCGAVEVVCRTSPAVAGPGTVLPIPLLAGSAISTGVLASVAWVALKVGALSYGGGFVIIPLMQADAVDHYHWMSNAQFLNAVALGQVTPGPVVQTVAVVGYAAAGVAGGILASAVAFSPSFVFILVGASRFDQLRGDDRVRAFLDGAGPAAIGAILGSAISLARALAQPWQFALLAAAAILIFAGKRGVVTTLLVCGVAGIVLVSVGAALPN